MLRTSPIRDMPEYAEELERMLIGAIPSEMGLSDFFYHHIFTIRMIRMYFFKSKIFSGKEIPATLSQLKLLS